jgi:hypothetical protein
LEKFLFCVAGTSLWDFFGAYLQGHGFIMVVYTLIHGFASVAFTLVHSFLTVAYILIHGFVSDVCTLG